ncbi:SET and MYND domain-containing protein 4-like [Culicoides brevitarsis]|uniref:SET and MYND domain-containing protein 4-like n=1 Tax=Culicoides brevitarsis TaxID=469753 RepID=UPI00307C9ABB
MPILDETIENACLHIRRQTSNDVFELFKEAQMNRKKQFEIIHKLEGVKYIEQFITKQFNKNFQYGMDFKNQGNIEFKQSRWNAALDFYNKSVVYMPARTPELAIALGNRSAVLFKLKEYQLAVNDIETAIPLSQKENLFKLVHRKAKCYLELEKYSEALTDFQLSEFLICNHDKISDEQRITLLFEIRSICKYLRRNCMNFVNEYPTNAKPIIDSKNKLELQVNDSVKIEYNKNEGRHAVCCNNIEAGDILLIEKPYAYVLTKAHNFTHCQYCLKRTFVQFSCDHCPDIVYCSESCKEMATFHHYECGILPSIWKCKSDLATHLSIRMITSKDINTLIYNGHNLEGLTETAKGCVDKNFEQIYSLLMHEKEFSKEKLFEFMLMAKFQLHCLKTGGYLKNDDYDDYFVFLLYKNILILHFNAHEVFELQKDNDNDPGKTICIAAAIYPFLAQFNHSCNPATVRYFNGNQVIIRATRNIAIGEQISENYGPIFTQEPKHERQLQLKEKYKFECRCEACLNNWPLLNEMRDSQILIKCSGCGETLKSNEFITTVRCPVCRHETAVVEIIKFIKTIDVNLNTARQLYKSNHTLDALEIYLRIMKGMDEYIKPPFSKWHICQKRIRSLYLEYGNKINFKLTPSNTNKNYFM